MKSIQNEKLNKLKIVKSQIDELDDDLSSISEPLTKKSGAFFFVGKPSSGKTSIWLSLLLSHGRGVSTGFYRKFDKVYLFSGSLDTLPMKELGLDSGRVFDSYDENKLKEIVKNEKDSADNNNVLIVFDDLIRDISGKKGMYLEKLILNRRHAIQNKDNDKVKSGLTIFITSQSYNMLPLRMRKNLSDIVLFSSTNAKELNSIKDELMYDLDKTQQNNILKHCWSIPYGFCYIKSNATTADRYYQNFNKIVI
jgi:hypothetical protein